MTTQTQTYEGNITIVQQSDRPGPGDRVENMRNGDIRITDAQGEKSSFQVRDGIITKEVSSTPWDRIIIGVLFVLMMILTVYLSMLWHF